MLQGIEPAIASDGTFELSGARHPLLVLQARGHVVPVDILLTPPSRVLIIAGPNTGGKTVALKTAGLLALMAQAGLHIPVEPGIAAAGVQVALCRHRRRAVDLRQPQHLLGAHHQRRAMDRDLTLPALVLLDEVGAGTDPAEGGALGIAVIDHFRQRGAHLIATTHYDSLKSYASTTEGVIGAAFGFNPENFAPTYRLLYGSPGRSLAIEIAARLGMPASVIAAARENLTEEQKQLADHLARVDDDLRRLETERGVLTANAPSSPKPRSTSARAKRRCGEREETLRRRVSAKVDDQVREARKEIDAIIEGLKAKAAELTETAAKQLREGPRRRLPISTGDTGAVRADGAHAVDQVVARLTGAVATAPSRHDAVSAGRRGRARRWLEGTGRLAGPRRHGDRVHGKHAEVDVRGKRLRARSAICVLIGDDRHGDGERQRRPSAARGARCRS